MTVCMSVTVSVCVAMTVAQDTVSMPVLVPMLFPVELIVEPMIINERRVRGRFGKHSRVFCVVSLIQCFPYVRREVVFWEIYEFLRVRKVSHLINYDAFGKCNIGYLE